MADKYDKVIAKVMSLGASRLSKNEKFLLELVAKEQSQRGKDYRAWLNK